MLLEAGWSPWLWHKHPLFLWCEINTSSQLIKACEILQSSLGVSGLSLLTQILSPLPDCHGRPCWATLAFKGIHLRRGDDSRSDSRDDASGRIFSHAAVVSSRANTVWAGDRRLTCERHATFNIFAQLISSSSRCLLINPTAAAGCCFWWALTSSCSWKYTSDTWHERRREKRERMWGCAVSPEVACRFFLTDKHT